MSAPEDSKDQFGRNDSIDSVEKQEIVAIDRIDWPWNQIKKQIEIK